MRPRSAPRWALVALGGLGLGVGLLVSDATAQPTGPGEFCAVYPDAPACAAGEASCTTCHVTAPALNLYGTDVAAALLPGEPRPLSEELFVANIGAALLDVEDLDSDDDGATNLEEIIAGTSPSDAGSVPAACVDADEGDGWNLCDYDVNYAYKKVMLDFCGRSPNLAEKKAFAAAEDPKALLHETLDTCLDTEFWRGIDGRVWNLANKKIAPLQAVKAGKDAGPIPLADYDDDYAYFLWTQTDDRDVRLVLTGQTFVSAQHIDGVTVLEEWDRTPAEDEEARGYDRAQEVRSNKRAGMLTHRWFLMVNTMFTAIPRTTGAQAYRAYLGYDISRLEGLDPVENEPVDYDDKGVGEPACAVCHSTLDPLTYPFSRYEGIGGGNANQYSYSADRMEGFVNTNGEDVANTPEAGILLGQEVEDLLEWAQVAANSEDFRRATVRDYWRMLMGEDPRPADQAEFGALVDGLGGDNGYRIEAMLHDLIGTEAYGAP